MEIILNKSQKQVANIAETDACVHIHKGIIEATDGFMFLQKPLQYTGEEDILLPAKIIKQSKLNKKTRTITLDSDDNKQTGRYPQLDQLVFSGKPVFKIALGREKLIKLLQNMSDEIIKFYFYGTTSPVKIETSGKEKALAVIMPMFIEL